MKRTQDRTKSEALLDDRTLADAAVEELLQSYLTLSEPDAETDLTRGGRERAQQAEGDVLETLRNVRERVELLARRYTD